MEIRYRRQQTLVQCIAPVTQPGGHRQV
ncbi:MAG: hypothetical protein RJB37_611, partial [Pseudomonadota bacterium]